MKQAYIMLGAPGSGKGTQGELFEKRSRFKRYIMSSLIKKELEKKEKNWTKSYDMSTGLLLGDSEVFDLFREYFGFEEGVILDGIPRTLDQAHWLYDFLKSHRYDIKVIFLRVNEENLLERILLRSQKEGRGDDSPEVFKERLRTYNKVKSAVLDVYKGEIIEVNGDLTVSQVGDEIKRKVGI